MSAGHPTPKRATLHSHRGRGVFSCANPILRTRAVRTLAVGFVLFSFGRMPQPVHATALDDIGYTQLQAELGAATPRGVGVTVSQIEAPAAGGAYAPTSSAYPTKTFNIKTGGTSPEGSLHANNVANQLYGPSAMASGIEQIDVYSAEPWLASSFLQTGSTAPKVELRDVENHSWVGSGGNVADQLRRLDYVVVRDDVVSVVGTANGSGSALPQVLTNSFNSIVVGITNGDHASGVTVVDASNRIVPHIVGPSAYSSFSTPMVSAAAAVLIGAARDNAGWAPEIKAAATRNEVVRSLLYAGATKEEFGLDWGRTPSAPLDSVYGSGELNIQRSYHTLTAGLQRASSSSVVAGQGWDLGVASAGSVSQTYFFDVGPTEKLNEFAAALTWNRQVTNSNSSGGFTAQHNTLANLNLKLYSASGFTLGTQLASSVSDDNTEYLYFNDTLGQASPLGPGRYALVVESVSGQAIYGLSWFRRFEENHHWISASSSGNWNSTANWSENDLPSFAWRAVLNNDVASSGRTSVVDADFIVSKVDVLGTTGRMTMQINSGRKLTARGGIEILEGGAISGGGQLEGQLTILGAVAIGAEESLSVTGQVILLGADLAVTDTYSQPRGTTSDLFTIVTATNITGQFDTPAANGITSHLGRGYFLQQVQHQNGSVAVEVVAAMPGDANGDWVVDSFDFNIWNANKSSSGTDWTRGDFNLDGMTNEADFALWNSNKFTSYIPQSMAASSRAFSSIPEPAGLSLFLLGLLAWSLARRAS